MRNCLIVSSLFAVSLIQCSKAEEPVKYPDAASYCTGRAQAECSDTVVTNCVAASKDACVTARKSACTSDINPSVLAGLTYNSARAEACVNEVASAYANAVITSDENKAINDACGLVFSGSAAKGAACSADADCKQSDNLRCVVHAATATVSPDGGTAEGTCQVPTTVGAGQSCSAAEAVCVDGFHCGSTSHCDADGEIGESCSAVAPCDATLKCASNGLCAAKLADNQPCSVTNPGECASGMCIAGATVTVCASSWVLSLSEPFCATMQ
jgi:hypothetical protein